MDKKVAILGLGYVGLPLTLRCVDAGFEVIGLDTDPTKINALNKGQSYLSHLDNDRIARLPERGFVASSDYQNIGNVDVIILCLPTPLDDHQNPDLSYITETLQTIVPYMHSGQMVVLESTTYPGTTEEVIGPILEQSDLIPGDDVAVVYAPEREDPGNEEFDTKTIPRVFGGWTSNCVERGCAFYKHIANEVVPMSSTRAAEMTKLLENIHRAVNIGLVNELKVVADAMGIDIHEVITAAATKPFGFVPYRPGPGLGGHCIPIDPFYLTWKAREYGVNTRFIELAGQTNRSMPAYVVTQITAALNDHSKPVRGSQILILGIAYKKNVADMRETPAAAILTQLSELGGDIAYHDPHISEFGPMRSYDLDLKSVPLTPELLAAQDCVVLVTDHDALDYDMILNHAKLIVDARGRLPDTDHVKRA